MRQGAAAARQLPSSSTIEVIATIYTVVRQEMFMDVFNAMSVGLSIIANVDRYPRLRLRSVIRNRSAMIIALR